MIPEATKIILTSEERRAGRPLDYAASGLGGSAISPSSSGRWPGAATALCRKVTRIASMITSQLR